MQFVKQLHARARILPNCLCHMATNVWLVVIKVGNMLREAKQIRLSESLQAALYTNVVDKVDLQSCFNASELSVHLSFPQWCPKESSKTLMMQDYLSKEIPIISVSKGLELGSGRMMSELIPQVLGHKQPTAFLSGPSFAREVLEMKPTGFVAASKADSKPLVSFSPLFSEKIVLTKAGTKTSSQLFQRGKPFRAGCIL